MVGAETGAEDAQDATELQGSGWISTDCVVPSAEAAERMRPWIAIVLIEETLVSPLYGSIAVGRELEFVEEADGFRLFIPARISLVEGPIELGFWMPSDELEDDLDELPGEGFWRASRPPPGPL